MKHWKVAFALVAGLVLATGQVYAAEKDPTISRIPADELEDAKENANPVAASPESIAAGKMVFEGKGTCFTCHGMSATGDGDAGAALDPSPRNLVSASWQDIRSDGEMFWVIANGSEGTGMIAYNPAMITDEETWQVINYMRSIKK